MKSLLIVFVSLFLSGKETRYISKTVLDNHFITITYNDASVLKSKIKKENSKRYFFLKDSSKVYIDVDQQAQWRESIDSLFKANTIRPKLSIGEPLPIFYLVFIIDKEGNIIQQGLDRQLVIDNYEKEFFRLMTLVKSKFNPAIVKGQKVASVLKLKINYYQLFEN